MATKKGQAAGAAVLLAIIMGLVILFLILIPPQERAKILGEEPTEKEVGEEVSSVKKDVKETLLQESPGRLSYIKEKEIEKLIPSTRIFTKTESTILAEREYLTAKSAAFSSQTEEIYFEIEDLAHTENIYLDLTIETYQGELIISLNNKEIFNKETNKFKPLKLPKHLLASENTLTFKTSSPGIAFWRTNQYELNSIKLVGDITDISAQESKHLFSVSSNEAQNIEEVTLRFSLSCVPEKMGKIEVKLNNYLVFSGVPENCEDIFYYDLPPEIIETSNNWLSFKTEEGDYEIYHIAVKIKLKTPSYPVHYFEIGDNYFITTTEEAECGEIDGTCPSNCDEDIDKDCCFQKYTTPHWCDARTENLDDRCVGHVNADNCERCPSGYEDTNNNPPENCEDLCGDDTDDYCPPGCNTHYDKDCCFEQSDEQFWCDDLPLTGIDFTCVDSISLDECDLCPSPNSYEGEETSPKCPEKEIKEGEEKLKEDYDIILILEFADGERKEAELYINGHKISFDTYKVEFSRNIDNYVEPWTNSIKIVPKTSFDIRELRVELKS